MALLDKSKKHENKPQAKLVVTSPTGCSQCNYAEKYPFHISITSITAEDEGWLAKGEGHRMRVNRHCPLCGQSYQALINAIPILCEPFNCPQCGKSETLHYKVNNITIDDKHSFEFEVEIECKICSKKRSLKKAVKELFGIIKLEVSPTGISVKNA